MGKSDMPGPGMVPLQASTVLYYLFEAVRQKYKGYLWKDQNKLWAHYLRMAFKGCCGHHLAMINLMMTKK